MCNTTSGEDTVTVVYTKREAVDLFDLLSRANHLKFKLRRAIEVLDERREAANRYRNWSA